LRRKKVKNKKFLIELAMPWLNDYWDKAWSYVDALSFALIQRMEIKAAISFDQHFGQPGWFKLIQ